MSHCGAEWSCDIIMMSEWSKDIRWCYNSKRKGKRSNTTKMLGHLLKISGPYLDYINSAVLVCISFFTYGLLFSFVEFMYI